MLGKKRNWPGPLLCRQSWGHDGGALAAPQVAGWPPGAGRGARTAPAQSRASTHPGWSCAPARIPDTIRWIPLLKTLFCWSVADPWHFGVLFSSLTFKMQAKNDFFNTIFSACYFLKVHLHNFLKIKSQKESLNSRNQGFSYYFCMMIEGSGSISLWLVNPDPGGPKTCGSGGSGSGSATLVEPVLGLSIAAFRRTFVHKTST